MRHVRDHDQLLEHWRDGVRTRMFVSAQTGARQLTMFEQWCDPGYGAPTHVHVVEEVLRVLDGEADIWVAGERRAVRPGESVIVPAGVEHGFINTGAEPLHTLAVLAEPIFEARYIDSGLDTRRWTTRLE
jgi:mannose-6-phosphate isomerase-like protein (cupin superfamily)